MVLPTFLVAKPAVGINGGTNPPSLIQWYCCTTTIDTVPDMFENYLDAVDAARVLKIHPETVKRLIREGKLQGTKFGNKWLIERDHLLMFVDTYDRRRGKARTMFSSIFRPLQARASSRSRKATRSPSTSSRARRGSRRRRW